MKTVKEAQEIILKHIKPMPVESVSIVEAPGRILSESVRSNRNHPPYDMSAMDGYAVRYEDIKGAGKDNPAVLAMVDDIRAGTEPQRPIKKGEAARIMTGGEIPAGADTVIRVEDTDTDGRRVKVFTAAERGTDIRKMGENIKKGERIFSPGLDLDPAKIGMLSMAKKPRAMVSKRPAVAVVATGDELEGIKERFNPKKIPNTNTYTVMAQLKAIGARPVLLGIARDNKKALKEKLLKGLRYDALVVTGGVSVGQYDFVRPTLRELGIDMLFWRVSIRPGHPFAFGVRWKTPVFALPGNPVSCMICFEEFVTPAIRKMMGANMLYRKTICATIAEDIKDKKGRTNFLRATLEKTPSGHLVRLAGPQGSAILMGMARADGLLIVPASVDFLEKGSAVTVQLLYGGFQETADIPE